MTWSETWHLTNQLLNDPSSHVGAAVAGWQYPVERTAMVLADHYDLTLRLKSGKKTPEPYPRPWDGSRRTSRPQVSQERIRSALAERGHAMR